MTNAEKESLGNTNAKVEEVCLSEQSQERHSAQGLPQLRGCEEYMTNTSAYLYQLDFDSTLFPMEKIDFSQQ